MKHLLFAAIASSFFISCQNTAKTTAVASKPINQKMEKENIYQFHVMDLSGNKFDFANLKGKKIMIVNTASKCGLTPQYKDLEAIYKEYQAKGFVVVGFPANDFASQEPGTNEEIGAFCEKNYGVTFPMMEKISVKGEAMHPLYQFLTQKSRNGVADSEVEWNFQKYLINERGELDKVISPKTSPTDPEVLNWIRS
ncbi:MAG TPA: glutathione peroxidase [Flavobacterium sp.]|jgi:glutathione peroxidase|nr:glutathione peroxidase [Flavobacterium sp.]